MNRILGLPIGNNKLDADEIAALQNSIVQFQFWRTTCNGTVNNASLDFYGTTLRASSATSDVVLLELLNSPGIGDGVNYAGWNRDGTQPSDNLSFIIHHPKGEDMRITTTKKVRTFFWNSDFWTAHYSSGTVAKGSSGSALFNQNNQIVGQLRSGWSSCDFTDFGDRYGKLSSSWSYANLKQWLSPTQNLANMSSLNIYPLTIQGSSNVYCNNEQYSVPNLLGCSYYWTPGPNLQIVSGQGTSTVTIKGTQTASANSTIQVQITDTKGRNRTAIAVKNLSLFAKPVGTNSGIPDQNILTTQIGGGYFDGFFTVTDPAAASASWTLQGQTPNSAVHLLPSPDYKHVEVQIKPQGAVAYYRLTTSNNCGYAFSDHCFGANVQCGINLQSESLADFFISPNPAGDHVKISVNNQPKSSNSQILIFRIKIINGYGMSVKTYENKSGVLSTRISLTNLNSGLYLVSIFDGQKWNSQQLIIQK